MVLVNNFLWLFMKIEMQCITEKQLWEQQVEPEFYIK